MIKLNNKLWDIKHIIQSILLFQASIAHICTKHKIKIKYTDKYKNIHKLFVQQTNRQWIHICRSQRLTQLYRNQFITSKYEMGMATVEYKGPN